jgi:hypothetical protein
MAVNRLMSGLIFILVVTEALQQSLEESAPQVGGVDEEPLRVFLLHPSNLLCSHTV